MAKKTLQSNSQNRSMVNPGMVLLATYIVLFLVNAVVVNLASNFFPRHIVLGTASMSPLWALVHSMGALTLIATFGVPLAHLVEQRLGRMLTSKDWMIAYFFVNFIGLWLITRVSDQFGLGISHWYVAAILAVVLDFVQGITMMSMQKKLDAAK